MEAILLHDTALQEIYQLGLQRHPAEACGILLPEAWHGSWIREIPNRSNRCHDSFEYTAMDIRLALEEWFQEATSADVEQIALWHTHPSGGVGPSTLDMRSRIEGARHLVVTITDEGPVPSWY